MQSFIGLCLLLLVGHLLRTKVRLIRKLYLPSCVVGGLVGLIVIQVCRSAGSPIPDVWMLGWKALPSMLINVVFACLFLGVVIPKLSILARRAGPQLGYGQIVAWGQYVVSLGLFIVLLQHLWELPNMFGAIVPVGFEGGHGTATGLAKTFAKRGWAEGGDVALTSATAGIISAVVVGMVLINWAIRRGHLVRKQTPEQIANAVDLAAGVHVDVWIVYGHDRFDFPLGAGTTAVIAPKLYPFLQTGQLVGFLGGLRGAADYELMLDQTGNATQGMQAQSVTHILLIVLIVGANARFIVNRLRGKQEA